MCLRHSPENKPCLNIDWREGAVLKKLVHSQSGLTLVEILLVVALIGLVAVLVLPRGIEEGISSAAIDTEASKIAGAVRLARQKAITSGSPYRISFTTGSYSIYPSDKGQPAQPSETFDEHVKLNLTLGGRNFIEFDASGNTSQTGTIEIIDKSSDNMEKRLRIYARGNVDIQSP